METLILYIVNSGRINFLQLDRYVRSCKQRYRQNFSKDFDGLEFNLSLFASILTGESKATAFDQSHISKSGKHIFWISYLCSSTANIAKRGLGIHGVSLIDIDTNYIHLQAVQTTDIHKLESLNINLLYGYLFVLKSMPKKLHGENRYKIADTYFARSSFAVGEQAMGFDLNSHFRDNVVLFSPALVNLDTYRVQKNNKLVKELIEFVAIAA